jgi:signal transduction histidine kinase
VVAAAVDAFETAAACVFILDEESGCYRPYFPLNKQASHGLAQQVFQCIRPVAILGKKTDWLDGGDPTLARLARASRPLKLSELCRAGDGVLSCLLDTTQSGESDPLLAPLLVEGRMVGWLVLGTRGDRQAYAGPDFEAIDLIQRRFTPVLETARLYALDSAHAALVMKLFTGLPQQPLDDLKTLEAVAQDYAKVIASAVSAGAELWLVGERDGARVLRRSIHVGPGPTLILQEPVWVGEVQWRTRLSPSFLTWHRAVDLLDALEALEAGGSAPVQPGESGSATFSCAWLPLLQGEELLGVLVLTYARPHTFSPKEQRLLALFANQCAAALDNTRLLLDLDAACAREIRWDRLRDEFLLAASRDLRMPLTTVGGYIEMVGAYRDRLPPEARAEFLAHAQRAAYELVLLVNNVMDALQLTDMEQAQLAPVALLPAISDILELLQGGLQGCGLSARVEVSPALHVLADGLRLRQILLSLLSNALASASAGTALEVSAQDTGHEVTVSVRSDGGSLPPEWLQRMFMPFSDSDAGASAPVGKAGLGLSISKQQVESMGGRIWVESIAGDGEVGSVFAFTLRSASLQQEPHFAASGSPDQASDLSC